MSRIKDKKYIFQIGAVALLGSGKNKTYARKDVKNKFPYLMKHGFRLHYVGEYK